VLQSIFVSGYKGIPTAGVRLESFDSVNYFVGENGSGKSSILHYIFETNRASAFFLTDSFTDGDIFNEIEVFQAASEIYTALIKKHIVCMDVIALARQNRVSADIISLQILSQAEQLVMELFGAQKDIISQPTPELDEEKISAGENKLVHIAYGVLLAASVGGIKYMCVDSPSTHLHPLLQKAIPILLHRLSAQCNIQIFVTTHSPFVLSACATVNSQRVYFLKNGQVAGKHGQITKKGSSGYLGAKVVQIAATMLGAGFSDIYSPQTSLRTPNSPVFVLCEGEGVQEDALIYNIMFRDHLPRVMFASSRGSSQLEKSFQILTQIRPALSVDFQVLMLRDRDHYFLTETDILEYESINLGAKVLRRRAIESYIFSEETAELLCKKVGVVFPKNARTEIQKIQNFVQWGVQHGIQGNEYKEQLEDVFVSHLSLPIGLWTRRTNTSLRESLAQLITAETQTYRELSAILCLHHKLV